MDKYYYEGYLTEKEIRSLKSDMDKFKYTCEVCKTFVCSTKKYRRVINKKLHEVCKRCYDRG